VSNSIKKEGEIVLGSPAIPAPNAKRSIAVYRNLPEMYRKINMLERELAEIKNHLKKE
jgi:UDP-3-O-[3-hydroxymyristoyl] glucosamine N-acyltransferase